MIEKPDKLLSKEKMTAILYDMVVLDAAKNTNTVVLIDNDIDVMEYIYKKHDIDSIQFVQSDVYYAALPAQYQEIYKGVETQLTAMKEKMDAEARAKIEDTEEDKKPKNTSKHIKKDTKVTSDSLP